MCVVYFLRFSADSCFGTEGEQTDITEISLFICHGGRISLEGEGDVHLTHQSTSKAFLLQVPHSRSSFYSTSD